MPSPVRPLPPTRRPPGLVRAVVEATGTGAAAACGLVAVSAPPSSLQSAAKASSSRQSAAAASGVRASLSAAAPSQANALPQPPRAWTSHSSRARATTEATLELAHAFQASLVVRLCFADAGSTPRVVRLAHARSPARAFEPLGEVELRAGGEVGDESGGAGAPPCHVLRLPAGATVRRFLRLSLRGFLVPPGSGAHRVSMVRVSGEEAKEDEEEGAAGKRAGGAAATLASAAVAAAAPSPSAYASASEALCTASSTVTAAGAAAANGQEEEQSNSLASVAAAASEVPPAPLPPPLSARPSPGPLAKAAVSRSVSVSACEGG